MALNLGSLIASLSLNTSQFNQALNGAQSAGSRTASFLSNTFKNLGIAGGLLSVGSALKSTLDLGVKYQSSLNSLGAVTQATGKQMEVVAAKARELGVDIELPSTSAATAAEAMLELAKGGLSVQDSMQAAKGTLQLAAAAQIDGGKAAQIQANALNAFGLEADQAGFVADVLANTANAASGEITDMAAGLKQTSAVAKVFGISVDETATFLGIFAKNGMIGSDAGTSLKSMLNSLASPSKEAKKAMDTLGITVYDSQGKFVGLRDITGQLTEAKKNLTQQEFTTSASILFGTDAIRAASNAAEGGVEGFDAMHTAVMRQGGAADISAAKMKGLGGAYQRLQNVVEDAQLALFDEVGGPMEQMVNSLSEAVPGLMQSLLPGLANFATAFIDILTAIGPVAGAMANLFGDVLNTAVGVLKPIALALAGVARWFTDLPGPVKAVVVGMLAFLALRGPFQVMFIAIRAHLMAARLGFISFGAAARGAIAAMGPVGWALTAVTVALSLFTGGSDEAEEATSNHDDAVKSLTGTLDANTNAITEQTKAQIIEILSGENKLKMLSELGLSQANYVDDIMAGVGANGKAGDAIKASTAAVISASQGYKDIEQSMNDAGISARDVAEAVLTDNWDNVSGKIETYNQSLVDAGGSPSVGFIDSVKNIGADTGKLNDVFDGLTGATTIVADAIETGADKIAAFGEKTDEPRVAFVKLQETIDKGTHTVRDFGAEQAKVKPTAEQLTASLKKQAGVAADATEVTSKLEDMFSKVDKTASLAEESVKFFGIQINKLAGINVTAKEATRLLNDQTRAAKEAWSKATEATKKHANGLVSAKGVIDTTRQSGADLEDGLKGMREAYDTSTTAVYDNTRKTQGAKAAMKAARDEADSIRATFIKQAGAANISAEKAAKLADKMGILEGKRLTPKTFSVSATGITSTNQEIVNIEGKKFSKKEVPFYPNTHDVRNEIANLENSTVNVSVKFNAINPQVVNDLNRDGTAKANGGIIGYAGGGYRRGVSAVARGGDNGAGVLWGEPQVGMEWYISGKRGQENNNQGFLADAASYFGGRYVPPGGSVPVRFANGGQLGVGSTQGASAGGSMTIVVEFRGDGALTSAMAREATVQVQKSLSDEGYEIAGARWR